MADRVYRSSNWSGVGLPVKLSLLTGAFEYASAVKLDVGEHQYIITEARNTHSRYDEATRIEKAYDQIEKTLNLLFSSGVKVQEPAPQKDVDIVRERGPAGYYTLRRRPNGTLCVHVKSLHSGAEYTVAKNPNGVIESTDRGWVFQNKSKHVDFVTKKGWL